MGSRRVFISADHGLAIVYFLQSAVVNGLLEAGVEVVLLTDDGLRERIQQSFGKPGLLIEGLRLIQARKYFQAEHNSIQWWLDFLRRAGAANRINLEAVDSYVRQVQGEGHPPRRILFPLMTGMVGAMRHSQRVRRAIVRARKAFHPRLH